MKDIQIFFLWIVLEFSVFRQYQKFLDFFIKWARIFALRECEKGFFCQVDQKFCFERKKKFLDFFIKWTRISVIEYKEFQISFIEQTRIFVLGEYNNIQRLLFYSKIMKIFQRFTFHGKKYKFLLLIGPGWSICHMGPRQS